MAEIESIDEGLRSIEQNRLALGTTPAELLAERVEDARTELIQAMRIADEHGEVDLHRRTAGIVAEVDDLRVMLADRGRS